MHRLRRTATGCFEVIDKDGFHVRLVDFLEGHELLKAKALTLALGVISHSADHCPACLDAARRVLDQIGAKAGAQ